MIPSFAAASRAERTSSDSWSVITARLTDYSLDDLDQRVGIERLG